MEELGRTFRDWVAAQKVDGCTTTVLDDDHIAIKHECMTGQVNFYCFDDMPDVVELAVTDDATGENRFFLHFELEDLERAQNLFNEMKGLLETACESNTTRVLLCCTVGMTTTMFANKMTEVTKTLSLDYTFEAKALEDAKREGGAYDAVMLAPQVGFRRREVAEALPDATVFEIPARIFARYDGAGALRMLMGVLGDESLAVSDPTDLRVMRTMHKNAELPAKTVLIISAIRRPHISSISWRLFDGYKLVASDEVHKPDIGFMDIVDIMATLRYKGVDLESLDAVGIAVPGSVDYGTVTFSGFGFADWNIEKELKDRFGVHVFVDNNANAGAVGCYVSQDTYDSVTLHTQQTGMLVGGQGTVCNGHLLRGHKGMAGELGALNWRVDVMDECYEGVEPADSSAMTVHREQQIAWSGEQMLPVLATMLQANIAIAAPDAIYINYDLVDDMNALRAELAKGMPEEFIPDLIHITDYHEKIFLGELALVLQRLTTSAK
ncbi:MAG: ROK family protein [Atopobiaceae bacterium]|nr:ROK family protein [Atopobiaceae bacterium]